MAGWSKHKYGHGYFEKKDETMKGGWFVAQNAEQYTDAGSGPSLEDCNAACARYTAVIQAEGFPGSLMCTNAALEVMNSVDSEAEMEAALEGLSQFSDPFPKPPQNLEIAEDTRDNVGAASPYFLTSPPGSPITKATFVAPASETNGGTRLFPQCNNRFVDNNQNRVFNRYCFCEYVNACGKKDY